MRSPIFKTFLLLAGTLLGMSGFVFARPVFAACPETIDDGVDCTIDQCDPKSDEVSHLPDNRRCEDSNVCTTNVCTTKGCAFQPIDPKLLEDGNACTKDFCDPKEGVLHQPIPIDDQDVCTIDSCDEKLGAQHQLIDPKINTVCSDGIGACRSEGKWICDAKTAEVACSAKALPPSTEFCNQQDDDCDGKVDNVAGLGEPCSEGEGECQANGVLECKGDGKLGCSVTAGNKNLEECDGVDNDCDGKIDEDLRRGCFEGPGKAGIGICREGHQTCEGGSWSLCEGQVLATSQEICQNNSDDDCDGAADEGCEVGKREPEVTPKTPKTVVEQPVAEPIITTVPTSWGQAKEPELTKGPELARKPAPKQEQPKQKQVEPEKPKARQPKEPIKERTQITAQRKPTIQFKTKDLSRKILPKGKEKKPKGQVEPRCLSNIFDCEQTRTLSFPFEAMDLSAILYPVLLQDSELYEKQIVLVAGHNRNAAGLAWLPVNEIIPDSPFSFHTCSLPEQWTHLEVGALEGEKANDVVVSTEDHRYGYLLNLDQILQSQPSETCVLVPQAWEDAKTPRKISQIHALKILSQETNAAKIVSVVELERGDHKVLALDLLSYLDGQTSSRLQEVKKLASDEVVDDVRVIPFPGGNGFTFVVTTAERHEWYDCSFSGGELRCDHNKSMADILPLAVLDGQIIDSEGWVHQWELFIGRDRHLFSRGQALGLARRGEKPLQKFNPLKAKGKATVANFEMEGQTLFLTAQEALRGYRYSNETTDLQGLNEYLTPGAEELVGYTKPSEPIPTLLNSYGGIDLFACFESSEGKIVCSFFENKNEPPELDLTTESPNKILVSASDATQDDLTCAAILKDSEGKDVSHLITKADCESVEIGEMEAKNYEGEVYATDPGGLLAGKGFTFDHSGGVVIGDGLEVRASEMEKVEVELITFGSRITGGGCSLRIP